MSFAPPHTACVARATGVTTGRSRHPPREVTFKETPDTMSKCIASFRHARDNSTSN